MSKGKTEKEIEIIVKNKKKILHKPGKKIGFLTIISHFYNNRSTKSNKTRLGSYYCKCKCGKIIIFSHSNLEYRTSCGCVGGKKKRPRKQKYEYRSEMKKNLIENSFLEIDHVRPRTRADCRKIPRPCPFVGCKYNTFLDVSHAGSIVFNGCSDPLEADSGTSCVLDIIENETEIEITEISKIMSIARERVHQILRKSLKKIQQEELLHEIQKI